VVQPTTETWYNVPEKVVVLFRLSAAVSIKTQYLDKRGKVFQLVLRVPSDLIHRVGKDRIRQSLRTTDHKEAIKKADFLIRKYRREWDVLRGNAELTAPEIAHAATEMIEQWTDEDYHEFISLVVDLKRERHARGDEEVYTNAEPKEYLSAVEIEAVKRFNEQRNPNILRLSRALEIYQKTHKRGDDETFIAKVKRDWDKLLSLVGDVPVVSLNRAHARQFVDHYINVGGLKTTSVRRSINHISSVLNVVIREAELGKINGTNPFENLSIQGEGEDSKERKVPSHAEIEDIVHTFKSKTSSVTSLMILLQVELGTRIGEVSGLGIDDVFLDHEIPHVYFRNRPWRTLKTDESERRVPVVGAALDALKLAVKLPREGVGLFDQYAKPRGNDNASAAVNKRLEKWGITSHCFRHAMKDRLREVGCPKDIRDAIQGHASSDIADTYGMGHTLQTMKKWLEKVKVAP
jgi:integrase